MGSPCKAGWHLLPLVTHDAFAQPVLEKLYHVGAIEGHSIGMREVITNESKIEIDAIAPRRRVDAVDVSAPVARDHRLDGAPGNGKSLALHLFR